MSTPDEMNGHANTRVALFSPYDGMGMGHVRRNLLIMENLVARRAGTEVLMISGSHEASVIPVGQGVNHLTIPGLRRGLDGSYVARSMNTTVDALLDLRTESIGAPLRVFAPDLFIVDKRPRGVLGELDPVLRAMRQTGKTKIVLGLRDVLDDPEALAREWREGGYSEAVESYYDAVWVYGDRRVYDLGVEADLPDTVARRLEFTGYLDQRGRRAQADPSSCDILAETGVGGDPFILCMVGGGEDGMVLAESFARAELPPGRRGILVAGPFMPSGFRHTLRELVAPNPRLRIVDFINEPTVLIEAAERVICMGGYGAATEVVSFEKPALIVPRARPRVEQLIRAERFAELGLADCLHPDRLTPAALSAWMREETSAGTGARSRIDLGGLDRIPRMVEALLRGETCPGGAEEECAESPPGEAPGGQPVGRPSRSNFTPLEKR